MVAFVVALGMQACGVGSKECKDLRQFGDEKNHSECWDPPEMYCAQGGDAIPTFACDPAFELCCTFGSTCIACGWSECVYKCVPPPIPPAEGCEDGEIVASDPRCPSYEQALRQPNDPACDAFMPHFEGICWDDSEHCRDLRQFGDYKNLSSCWDPPERYCAQGAGQLITAACNAEQTLCCIFSSTCVPCGWTQATAPDGALYEDWEPGNADEEVWRGRYGAECSAVRPDMDATFCWDDLPPDPGLPAGYSCSAPSDCASGECVSQRCK